MHRGLVRPADGPPEVSDLLRPGSGIGCLQPLGAGWRAMAAAVPGAVFAEMV